MDLDVELPAIALGDAQAFGRWASSAEPQLRLSLRAFAGLVDAEAVLQETLLRVWQVAPRFSPDGRPNALLRFAVRTGQNLARDELRRLRPRTHHQALHDVEGRLEAIGEPSPPDPLLRRAIADCGERLPPKPAEALFARLEAQGTRSDEGLADGLGMRLNTFLQNFTRARRFLEDCLEKKGVRWHEEL